MTATNKPQLLKSYCHTFHSQPNTVSVHNAHPPTMNGITSLYPMDANDLTVLPTPPPLLLTGPRNSGLFGPVSCPSFLELRSHFKTYKLSVGLPSGTFVCTWKY